MDKDKEEEKELFETTYPDLSFDDLEDTEIKFRDASKHYYHPDTNQIYSYQFLGNTKWYTCQWADSIKLQYTDPEKYEYQQKISIEYATKMYEEKENKLKEFISKYQTDEQIFKKHFDEKSQHIIVSKQLIDDIIDNKLYSVCIEKILIKHAQNYEFDNLTNTYNQNYPDKNYPDKNYPDKNYPDKNYPDNKKINIEDPTLRNNIGICKANTQLIRNYQIIYDIEPVRSEDEKEDIYVELHCNKHKINKNVIILVCMSHYTITQFSHDVKFKGLYLLDFNNLFGSSDKPLTIKEYMSNYKSVCNYEVGYKIIGYSGILY
jgi:hypothetical protein